MMGQCKEEGKVSVCSLCETREAPVLFIHLKIGKQGFIIKLFPCPLHDRTHYSFVLKHILQNNKVSKVNV